MSGPRSAGVASSVPGGSGPLTFDEMKTQWSPAEVTRPRIPDALIKPMPPTEFVPRPGEPVPPTGEPYNNNYYLEAPSTEPVR